MKLSLAAGPSRWNAKQDRLAKACRSLAAEFRDLGREDKAKHYEAQALKCESFKEITS